jgi:hypothetical protein
MAKWLFTLCLTVVVAGLFMPRLARLLRRIGMPGDIAFRIRGWTIDSAKWLAMRIV